MAISGTRRLRLHEFRRTSPGNARVACWVATVGFVLLGCSAISGPPAAYVEPFRRLPGSAQADWLANQSLSLEPFVAGSIHTPVTLASLPIEFHARFPEARRYRPLWARERDAAVFLHDAVVSAVARRLRARSSNVRILPATNATELQRHYEASGHLELGGFRPVLFDPRAAELGDASIGNDQFTKFRKAFLVATTPVPNGTLRLVTGYFGLHCAHELVGRANTDKSSARLDWLVALVEPSGRVLAEAYVGAVSDQWKCALPHEDWENLLDAIADRLILAMLVPARRT